MCPQKKLKAVTKVGPTSITQPDKTRKELHTKSVITSINELDCLVCRNKNKHKLTSLDLINQATRNNGTPDTLASVYDPLDQTKIIKENLLILIDSGTLHSMAKASLVKKYKHLFFKRSEAPYKTASGTFKSKHSMKIMYV